MSKYGKSVSEMRKRFVEILRSGEGERVEFKKSLSEKDQILVTISAFSNSHGGSIYIGVDDTANVIGVQLGKKTVETLANDVKLTTDPKVFPSIETIPVSGKDVIHIAVTESPIKPVWVVDKVFERVGKTNQRVPAERIRQIILKSQPFQ
jgi:ATP-dependent DNA helicase RecG